MAKTPGTYYLMENPVSPNKTLGDEPENEEPKYLAEVEVVPGEQNKPVSANGC